MYRRGSILLKSGVASMRRQKLSTSNKVDPKLLEKFKGHPTIPRTQKDLNEVWHHIPDDLLPTNWSCNWDKARCHDFLPGPCWGYGMGKMDIFLNAMPYPIKGVMYCIVERINPRGSCYTKPEGFVFQDAIGDYYYYHEFSLGGDEYLAKFRAHRGTTVSDFAKHHFRGAVRGVDMDLVLPEEGRSTYYDILRKEQRDLVELHERCACTLHKRFM